MKHHALAFAIVFAVGGLAAGTATAAPPPGAMAKAVAAKADRSLGVISDLLTHRRRS